jgi:uncharacterized integral membrane protein
MSEPQVEGAAERPDERPEERPDERSDESQGKPPPADPLRGSRTSRVWVSVTALAVIVVLLVVFVAQNTDRVSVRFFGWTWHAPLAVEILVGAVAGMLLAVVAGTLRIWQLHRRVRRVRRVRRASRST